MSYQITVAVKDGAISVTRSGDVPEGEISVSGHEDPTQRTLSVSRRGPDGRYVQQASTTHHKEA